MRTTTIPPWASTMKFAVLLGVLSLVVTATAAPPPEPVSTPAYITAKKGTANPWICLSSTRCKLVGNGPETEYGDYLKIGPKERVRVTCKYTAPNYFKSNKYVASSHTYYFQ
jgi:hypothetical protein